MAPKVRARHAPAVRRWWCAGCRRPLGEVQGSTLVIGRAVRDLQGLTCDAAGVLTLVCRHCQTATVFNDPASGYGTIQTIG